MGKTFLADLFPHEIDHRVGVATKHTGRLVFAQDDAVTFRIDFKKVFMGNS
jgi:hypothetical protein